MPIAGPVAGGFWRQQQTTLSELLLRTGNQRAARLLSLVSAAELGEADVWDPVQVVLMVRPIFLDLFLPAELQAIAEQMNRLKSWDDDTGHQVTVAPLLADPFARATLGAGTTAMQLREAIAEALHPVKSYDLPDVCQAFGLTEGNGEEAYASKRNYVRSRIQDYTEDQLLELGSRVVETHYLPELWGLLQVLGDRRRGVRTPFRNIIFAADGPKPELVLADAVSNTIEIVKNEQFCLVFDRPLNDAGLAWADLVAWWASTRRAGREQRSRFRQPSARSPRPVARRRPPCVGRTRPRTADVPRLHRAAPAAWLRAAGPDPAGLPALRPVQPAPPPRHRSTATAADGLPHAPARPPSAGDRDRRATALRQR